MGFTALLSDGVATLSRTCGVSNPPLQLHPPRVRPRAIPLHRTRFRTQRACRCALCGVAHHSTTTDVTCHDRHLILPSSSVSACRRSAVEVITPPIHLGCARRRRQRRHLRGNLSRAHHLRAEIVSRLELLRLLLLACLDQKLVKVVGGLEDFLLVLTVALGGAFELLSQKCRRLLNLALILQQPPEVEDRIERLCVIERRGKRRVSGGVSGRRRARRE